jgi:hypothetical protein
MMEFIAGNEQRLGEICDRAKGGDLILDCFVYREYTRVCPLEQNEF